MLYNKKNNKKHLEFHGKVRSISKYEDCIKKVQKKAYCDVIFYFRFSFDCIFITLCVNKIVVKKLNKRGEKLVFLILLIMNHI